MILNLSHEIVRTWVDKNLDTYVASIKHRANLDPTPVLTPTGKIKVKSVVFDLKLFMETKANPEKYHGVLDWLHEQEFDGQWCVSMEHNRFAEVAFANRKDAAMFKLVWMDDIRYEYTK